MDFYVTEFNYLNHTNFKVNDLFCNECKEIFNTKIYSFPNEEDDNGTELNYCHQCYSSGGLALKSLLVKNHFLAKKLSKAQFLCKHESCNFKGGFFDFHKHWEFCMFKPTTLMNLICPMDNEVFTDAVSFIEHLLQHSNVKKLTLDSLSLRFELDLQDKENKIIVANYKDKYFILFTKFDGETVSLKMGKHWFGHSLSGKPFTMVRQFEEMEIHQKGVLLPLQTLLKDEGNTNCLLLKVSSLSPEEKIHIYFSDFEIIQSRLNDCPICFNHLFGKVKQCKNAHTFCLSCASKIEKCPICREYIMSCEVDLKYISPNYDFPCKNFDDGCVELVKSNDVDEHRNVCAYRQIKCTICDTQFYAYNFYAHINKEHQLVSQNYSIFTISAMANQIKDIIYRSKLFRVKFKSCHYYKTIDVSLLNDDTDTKYRYEVIFFKDTNFIFKVCNIVNSPINISPFPEVNKLQCNIIHNC